MVQRLVNVPARGFSLVEVLVTLMIVGVAVMGFVIQSLHASASVYEAALQVQARILAADTIERIKSNLLAWPSGFINSPVSRGNCTSRTPCITPVMQAAYDMKEVGVLAQHQLPSGKIAVFDRCAEGDSLPCVVVAWSDAEPTPASCKSVPVGNAVNEAHQAPRCVLIHFVSGV